MSPEKIIELARKALEQQSVEDWNSYPWVFADETLQEFANLVAQLERERIATSIERLPFGDTAASFAIYVRELKDE